MRTNTKNNKTKKLGEKARSDLEAREERLRTMPIVSVEPLVSGSQVRHKTKIAGLTQLRQKFREEFCRKIDEWAEAYMTPLADDRHRKERERFAEAWWLVRLSIGKSNALWRLLYAGEELRKKPCPVHKGHWSGVGPNPGCGCWSYGNITGWLAEEPDNPDAPKPPVRLVRLKSRTRHGKRIGLKRPLSDE